MWTAPGKIDLEPQLILQKDPEAKPEAKGWQCERKAIAPWDKSKWTRDSISEGRKGGRIATKKIDIGEHFFII